MFLRWLNKSWLIGGGLFLVCLAINVVYAYINGIHPVWLMFKEWPEAASLWSWLLIVLLLLLSMGAFFLTLALLFRNLIKKNPVKPMLPLLGKYIALMLLCLIFALLGSYENFREPDEPSFFINPRAAWITMLMPTRYQENAPEPEPLPISKTPAQQLFLQH